MKGTRELIVMAMVPMLLSAGPTGCGRSTSQAPTAKQRAGQNDEDSRGAQTRPETSLLLGDDFKIVRSVGALPGPVKSAFAALVKEPVFEMADPGQPFQGTDVITQKGLPWRRLIFAGISETKCFLHYEKGGRGHAYYVVVFAINATGGASFLRGGPVQGPASDITQLRARTTNAYLSEYPNWYW